MAVSDIHDAAVAPVGRKYDSGLGEVKEGEGGGIHGRLLGGVREKRGTREGTVAEYSEKMSVCTVLYDFLQICFTVPVLCECSSMVEYDLPKVGTRVRFPSLAPREFLNADVAQLVERRYRKP